MSHDFGRLHKAAYVVVVNHKEFVERAHENGFENVYFYKRLPVKLKEKLRNGLLLVRINYEDGRDSFCLDRDYDYNYYILTYNLFNTIIEGKKRVKSVEDALQFFPTAEELETALPSILGAYGVITDYTGRCGNCAEKLGKNDKYCKYCGTPRGEGKFRPYENTVETIYGPPVRKKFRTRHKCMVCGHRWTVRRIDDLAEYCPQCGGGIESEIEEVI